MINFKIQFSQQARDQLNELVSDNSKKPIAKSVVKSLEYMRSNLKHPSLNTHKYNEIKGPKGEEVFESYSQNNTPGAYRIFWFYGPNKSEITILAITPHP